MREVGDWFREPCVGPARFGASDFYVDNRPEAEVRVERTPLDGLPEGAVTVHWDADDAEAWSTIIPSRQQQTMMIAVWLEESDRVPTDTYVDVVNTAWAEFETANS